MQKRALAIFLFFIPVQHLIANDRLIVCGHQNLPPFMWKENNTFTGAAVTVTKTIFSKLNIDVDATYRGDWKRCLFNIKTGKADLVVAAYRTSERKKSAKFTKTPLVTYPLSIFVWKGREFEFTKWDDLKNLIMAGVLGDSFGEAFDEFIDKNVTVHRVRTNLQQYKLLESGRINFYPNGRYIGLMQLQQAGYQGQIIPLEHPVLMNELYIAMSKKSKFLQHLPFVSQQLIDMAQKGEIENIIQSTIAAQTPKN